MKTKTEKLFLIICIGAVIAFSLFRMNMQSGQERTNYHLDVTGHWEDNSALFDITTDLPDGIELTLTLGLGDYSAESRVIIADGKGESEGFSDNGRKLSGDYQLVVSVPDTHSDNTVDVEYIVSLRDEIVIQPVE